jgi:inner membrane protein
MDNEKKTNVKKFTQGYTFKILMLVFLVLMLLIPLSMIRSTIGERNRTAKQAEANIMEAWGGELVASGPFISLPGTTTIENPIRNTDGTLRTEIIKKPFTIIIAPEQLNIETELKTEVRRRGIFSVPLFHGELRFSGTFNPAMALAALQHNEEVHFDQAELVISLSSQKGIRKIEKAVFGSSQENNLMFLPGNNNLIITAEISRLYDDYRFRNIQANSGINAAVPEFSNAKTPFDIVIAMQGGQLLRFLPAGRDTHVKISTDWASPSFQGSFLPGSSQITDNGFEAEWDISYLSRDIPLYWKYNNDAKTSSDYSTSLFGVNFFRAINTYSLNTRAVKYAILFLVIPFLTLFLLEVLTKKLIHPVPYLLSGIANVIFYLLLLSLSEQMQFYLAYLIAAVAVAAMLTLYSRSLLPSWNKSAYMGLVVSLSYILLYAVLNAESYALLIGSIGAFVVIGVVMYLTRKLDWYAQAAD